MPRFLRAITAAAAIALLTPAALAAEGKPSKLLTILTAPEPQTQLMAMVLTMQAVQQGAEVHILLCGPAGDLALKDAPESATAPQKPKGMSPQGLMNQIRSKGGTVEVCAIYLPNKGLGTDALIEGVAPAEPPAMTTRILAEGTRIISF